LGPGCGTLLEEEITSAGLGLLEGFRIEREKRLWRVKIQSHKELIRCRKDPEKERL
jgi:hypothetical protein